MQAGDDDLEIEGTVTYKKGVVQDWSKLDRRDGVIYYKLYRQDGTMEPMTCPDTYANRCYVSWMQIHDRYTPQPTTSKGG